MLRRALPLLLTAAVALPAVAATEEPPEPRTVVAPIDTGINPYHEAFRVDDPAVDEHVLDEFGIDDDHVLEISDSYHADVDAGLYDDVVEGELYHFAGTNILAYSTGFGDRPFLPDDDRDVHGTGVTGAVVNANPETVVLFVEGIADADAETYAFTHPGVDIVTTSYGFITSAPVHLTDSYTGVVEQGKLHFGAATNDPTLSPTDGTSGPWWSIGIAGFGEDGGEGREILSGNAPDFVADWTQDLPYCATCTEGTESVNGTSFATPRSAGTMSAVLLEARRRAGHIGGISEDGLMVDTPEMRLSNWDLRRALEEGSYIPEFTTSTGLTQTPINPLAPYVQIGWGAITPDPEHEVIDRTTSVLLGESDGFKSDDTCTYMTQYMTARYAMWDANPTSDSFGETNALGDSPYLAC